MKNQTREFKLDVLGTKDIADTGTFTGLTAVYGNVDEGGDRIQAGAFAKTIQMSSGRLPLLWSHENQSPIGVAKLSDTGTGLLVNGVLNLNKSIGRDAYEDLKFYQAHDVPFGMSIGFQTIKSYMDGAVRVLTEIKLFESSLTLFPMNQAALVESVKANRSSSNIDTKITGAKIAELTKIIEKATRELYGKATRGF